MGQRKNIVMKFVGVDHQRLSSLHEYANSPEAHIFSGPNNPGIKCVEILGSRLDDHYGTYTMEVQVATEMGLSNYKDAEGRSHASLMKQKEVVGSDYTHGTYHVQIPSEILLKVLEILGHLGRPLEVVEVWDKG